jgi:FtsP/CotA-like multicopper oxidase with cupredoxin domain
MQNIEIRNGSGMSGKRPTTRRHRRRIRTIRTVGVVAAVAVCATAAAFVPLSGTSQAQGALSQGMLCTSGTSTSAFATPAANTNRVFDLHAKSGYSSEPDGNSIYDWSYTARTAFQLPGPVMCANVGDTIEVHLTNDLPVATSIQFPGQSNVTYELVGDSTGQVPVAPVADATTGELASLVQGADTGHAAIYRFTATAAGTYLYESGTDPQLQVQMGLFGALVIYPNVAVTPADVAKIPADGTGGKTNGDLSGFDATTTAADATCAYVTPGTSSCDPLAIFETDRENILMLSEVDPGLHSYMEQNEGDATKLTWDAYPGAYAPHYYLINGRSMPDTIAPNNAPWLPSQPYGSLATVQPWTIDNPLDAMLRYVAVGVTGYDFHPHSNHEHVIAQDGALMKGVVGGTVNDNTEEKFNILVGPGSTVDATFRWTNEEGYSDTTDHRVPVIPPQSLNLTEGDFWSGSPYLGATGQLNPGILGKTQCGEYYHVAHSHDLSQVTNYGITFGGMLTLIKVEPTPSAANDFDLKCNG